MVPIGWTDPTLLSGLVLLSRNFCRNGYRNPCEEPSNCSVGIIDSRTNLKSRLQVLRLPILDSNFQNSCFIVYFLISLKGIFQTQSLGLRKNTNASFKNLFSNLMKSPTLIAIFFNLFITLFKLVTFILLRLFFLKKLQLIIWVLVVLVFNKHLLLAWNKLRFVYSIFKDLKL